MDSLPRLARWYLYGIWGAASVAGALAIVLSPVPSPLYLLGGLIAFVLADYFAVELVLNDQTEIQMTCVDTVQVFLAATAGPWGVLVPFAGSLLSDGLAGRAWYKGLFNASQRSLAYLVLSGIYQLLGASWTSPFQGWGGLVALALMAGLYLVLNPLFVSLIAALSTGQPPLKVYIASVNQVQWIHFITLPLGAVLAVLWHYEPWMLLPAILPLVMAYRSFKTMASLQHESRRSKAFAEQAGRLADKLERLQDTTTAMLASDEPRPLLELVGDRLAALLHAPAAWAILVEPEPEVVATRGVPADAAIDIETCLVELRYRTVHQSAAGAVRPWSFVLYIPMLTAGRLVGGFCLALPEPLVLPEDDRRVLLAFAAQTAVAVERTRLSDQLRTKQDELLRTSKLAAMGTLAAGIAHEFNNLLTAIAGFAQLGLTTDNPAEKDEALQVALRTSKRGHSITAGLLTFARRRETRRELCQLRDVVDETLLLVERQLNKANVTVRREYEPIPETICEPGQIAQVVMNLVTNARDAMVETDGGTLVIGLAARDGQIELRVSDTGVGIPEDLLPQIFQPFITTKAALGGSSPSGTGLGLAIINGIIESHRGSIEVQSEVGKGTTVLVRLPVITSDEEEPGRVSSEGQPQASA